MKIYLVAILQIFIFINCAEKSKYLHPIDDEEYKILVTLTLGRFQKPVKERSVKEKSAVVRFWRAKGKFSVGQDKKLYYDGKQVRIDNLYNGK
jgi:hypothetical protein